MRRLFLTALILLTPLVAATLDISGKWSGSMNRPTDDGPGLTPIVAEFQLDGTTVRGMIGVVGQPPFTIEKGILDGDRLSFEVHVPNGTYVVKLAVVSASELKGETTFTDTTGRTGTAPLMLSRS